MVPDSDTVLAAEETDSLIRKMIAKSGLTVYANPMHLAAKRQIGWTVHGMDGRGWSSLV